MGLFSFLKKKNNTDVEKEQENKNMSGLIKKIEDWNQELESIPKCPIQVTSFEKSVYPEDAEIKFSAITKTTKKSNLGNFVVIDTETTGLRKNSSILELSAIRYIDFKPTECFDTYVKPRIKTWEEAEEVNGISPEMVKDAPSIKDVATAFLTFVGNDNIVGHNLQFDVDILENKGVCFLGKRKFYDTLTIAQKHLKKPKRVWNQEYEEYEIDYDSEYDVEDYKLDTICAYYDIFRGNSHKGNSDCLATAKIFIEMIDEITEC